MRFSKSKTTESGIAPGGLPKCPTGIHGLTPKSVKKKRRQPSFAAAVNRDDVTQGAEQLGVDFDEHVTLVIAALEERATELGLDGSADAAGAG